jgi:hypothetical protein
MISNSRTGRRVRQWSVGVGFAAAATVAAGIIGLAVAPSARADDPSPADLLGEAGTNITDANHVLNEIPAIGTPAETALVNEQLDVQFQLDGLPLPGAPDVGGQLATLESAESAISSYNNGSLDSFVNPLFTNLDQNWLQASEALLTADQGFETAAADGASPIAAELAIYSADLSLLGDAASSLSIDWASSLF